MSGLLGLYALVLASMASRDGLGTISTACIVHGRKLLAGCFDGLCDIAGVVSITATGAVTLEHGVTAETGMAFVALFVGSVLGTYAGMTAGDVIERRFGPRE